MQRDNATGLGSGYTTLFREYDPEIARWKSLDPKLKDFPSESPFSAMGNNPIMNTDVLGDIIFKMNFTEQNNYNFEADMAYLKTINSPTINSIISKAEGADSKIYCYYLDVGDYSNTDINHSGFENTWTIGKLWEKAINNPNRDGLAFDFTFSSEQGGDMTADVLFENQGKNTDVTNIYDIAYKAIIRLDEFAHATSTSELSSTKAKSDHWNLYFNIKREIDDGIIKVDEAFKDAINHAYNRARKNLLDSELIEKNDPEVKK